MRTVTLDLDDARRLLLLAAVELKTRAIGGPSSTAQTREESRDVAALAALARAIKEARS